MPDPVEIRDGDIVLVQRVELYYARVERAGPRDVVIEPLNPRIRDRRVRVDEVRQVYRSIGRPGPPPTRLRPSPRQLRLDDDRPSEGG
ncbi:MAG: hypothetical protein QOF04_3161 [Solirubrobacteraceae bacterium]|jgi:hypothetical protein|nr:hypothetical protein [Solirubrobacteraceae bacterium]